MRERKKGQRMKRQRNHEKQEEGESPGHCFLATLPHTAMSITPRGQEGGRAAALLCWHRD